MITCNQCGKANGGRGEQGTSWICEDCRIDQPSPNTQEETPDNE